MPKSSAFAEEPTMSDTTILVTVEDLISRAMGPPEANIVNFKLLQSILYILARQQRLLEQRVEIRVIELKEGRRKKHTDDSTEEVTSSDVPFRSKSKDRKSPRKGKASAIDMHERAKQKYDKKEQERYEEIKGRDVSPRKRGKSVKEAEEDTVKERKMLTDEEKRVQKESEKAKIEQKERDKKHREKEEKTIEMNYEQKSQIEKETEKGMGHEKFKEKSKKEKDMSDKEEEMEQKKIGKMQEEVISSVEKEKLIQKGTMRQNEPEKISPKMDDEEKMEKRIDVEKKKERAGEKGPQKEREISEKMSPKEIEKLGDEEKKEKRIDAEKISRSEGVVSERELSQKREDYDKTEKRPQKERLTLGDEEKMDKRIEVQKISRSESEVSYRDSPQKGKDYDKAQTQPQREKDISEKKSPKEIVKLGDEEKKMEKGTDVGKISRSEKEVSERESSQKREESDKAEKRSQKEREISEKQKVEERQKYEKSEQTTRQEKEISGAKQMKEEREEITKRKAGVAETDKRKTDIKQVSKSTKEIQSDRKIPTQRSSIQITEKVVDKEKILVVGQGPTPARASSSIEVVTHSEFALLEQAVNQLRSVAQPPPLTLPDNRQLVNDVMKGTATLPDAMNTLQIEAKLRAAEAAVVRMAGLLAQVAAAGGLPDEVLEQLETIDPVLAGGLTAIDNIGKPLRADESRPVTAKKSVAIGPQSSLPKAAPGFEPTYFKEQAAELPTLSSRPSAMSRASRVSTITAGVPCVTTDEMNDALNALRSDIMRRLNGMTERTAASAENASHFAKTVADKLDVALQLDRRISSLHSMVGDYTEQLEGFDAGLTTQMRSFQDQMAEMRSDLKAGLLQLENVNNNAETAAVQELTERYLEQAASLERTLHAHKALTALQESLSLDMRSLMECMEMLREQKADRDEVLDGLRDKADTSRLAGLLSMAEFAEARADFERRIDVCHDKFARQDEVWQEAIKDLKAMAAQKAELVELLSARDDTQRQLQLLSDRLRVLAACLGEPKAALLTRKLAQGATCGACHGEALMEPYERAHAVPRELPALRPPPVGASEDPCATDWPFDGPLQARHMCHRWCGGSHTLVAEPRREPAPPAPCAVPTKKFRDYGDDGRLYMMEVECEPCIECNVATEKPPTESVPKRGEAGDMSTGYPFLECTCPLTK